MSTAVSRKKGRLRIKRVLGDTFAVFSGNFIICILLIAIFFLSTYLNEAYLGGGANDAAAASEDIWTAYLQQMGTMWGVQFPINLVMGTILEVALIRVACDHLNGLGPATIGNVVRSFASLGQALGLSIIVGIVTFVGSLLLVIPGVYFSLCWFVAMPVLLQERCGVMDSLLRSAALTKGNLWRILWLLMILGVPIMALVFAEAFIEDFTSNVSLAVQMVGGGLWSALLSVVSAATYVELRRLKESGDVNELVEVFA